MEQQNYAAMQEFEADKDFAAIKKSLKKSKLLMFIFIALAVLSFAVNTLSDDMGPIKEYVKYDRDTAVLGDMCYVEIESISVIAKRESRERGTNKLVGIMERYCSYTDVNGKNGCVKIYNESYKAVEELIKYTEEKDAYTGDKPAPVKLYGKVIEKPEEVDWGDEICLEAGLEPDREVHPLKPVTATILLISIGCSILFFIRARKLKKQL